MGDVVRLPQRSYPPHSRRTQETERTQPTQQTGPTRQTGPTEPLWRELVGAELRAERQTRGDRLADVANRSGVSTQYLSEVERGLKDPSSEILAAVAGALDLTVRQLTIRVAQTTSARTTPGGGTLCLAA